MEWNKKKTGNLQIFHARGIAFHKHGDPVDPELMFKPCGLGGVSNSLLYYLLLYVSCWEQTNFEEWKPIILLCKYLPGVDQTFYQLIIITSEVYMYHATIYVNLVPNLPLTIKGQRKQKTKPGIGACPCGLSQWETRPQRACILPFLLEWHFHTLTQNPVTMPTEITEAPAIHHAEMETTWGSEIAELCTVSQWIQLLQSIWKPDIFRSEHFACYYSLYYRI